MPQDGCGWCRDESGLLLPSRMSLGQRRVWVPTASGWSCVSREIYKVEQRKIPRYSRVSYHQKGTRTQVILKVTGLSSLSTADSILMFYQKLNRHRRSMHNSEPGASPDSAA